MTPEVKRILNEVNYLIGYEPYLNRISSDMSSAIRIASDNRVELDRARDALQRASAGQTVAIVSGGDPGIFAMAAAVFEAIQQGPKTWRTLDVQVHPGVTAMVAAAARLGAPLGHDFCAISLSTNLKPWSIIERRLKAAAEADFVISLYNPISKARPDDLDTAFDLLRSYKSPDTPVAFATAIGRPDEVIDLTNLRNASGKQADMRTLVLIGSSQTVLINRENDDSPWLLTPRSYASS